MLGLLGVGVGRGEEPETPQGHQGKQVQGGRPPHFTREPQVGLAEHTQEHSLEAGRLKSGEREAGGAPRTPSELPTRTHPSASSAPSCGPCRHSCPWGGNTFGAPDNPPNPLSLNFLSSVMGLKSQSSESCCDREQLCGRSFQNRTQKTRRAQRPTDTHACTHTDACTHVCAHTDTPTHTSKPTCTQVHAQTRASTCTRRTGSSHAPVSTGVASVRINRHQTHTLILRKQGPDIPVNKPNNTCSSKKSQADSPLHHPSDPCSRSWSVSLPRTCPRLAPPPTSQHGPPGKPGVHAQIWAWGLEGMAPPLPRPQAISDSF